jgi:hypothetical protein
LLNIGFSCSEGVAVAQYGLVFSRGVVIAQYWIFLLRRGCGGSVWIVDAQEGFVRVTGVVKGLNRICCFNMLLRKNHTVNSACWYPAPSKRIESEDRFYFVKFSFTNPLFYLLNGLFTVRAWHSCSSHTFPWNRQKIVFFVQYIVRTSTMFLLRILCSKYNDFN